MQATITPTRTGFDLSARLADGWRALRPAAADVLRTWHAAHERRQTQRARRRLGPRGLLDFGAAVSEIPWIAAPRCADANHTHRVGVPGEHVEVVSSKR